MSHDGTTDITRNLELEIEHQSAHPLRVMSSSQLGLQGEALSTTFVPTGLNLAKGASMAFSCLLGASLQSIRSLLKMDGTLVSGGVSAYSLKHVDVEGDGWVQSFENTWFGPLLRAL